MNGHIYYSAGHTNALNHAIKQLRQKGGIFSGLPYQGVTHLLLDVPSFEVNGTLKGGRDIQDLLNNLSKDITVIGGNLTHPALEDYKTIDLLQDPLYLSENADITAYCAIRLAMENLPITLRGCPTLVIGWGRIGKCLARLLKQLGGAVTVAARKETDRAMLSALGYNTADPRNLESTLSQYRVIFNTAPVMILPEATLSHCREECLKIDLASVQGMDDDTVLWARGLPNRIAPESSGALIARTILRLG